VADEQIATPFMFPPIYEGRHHSLYVVEEPALVMVASDRVSAFDVVLPTEIPDKGKILTALTLWWFGQTSDIVPNHLLSSDIRHYPEDLRFPEWAGRSMYIRQLRMLGAECVARGNLSGSATAEYQRLGSVCGVRLPEGLVEGSDLPELIFTPTTKAPPGQHDLPLTYQQYEDIVGDPTLAAEVKRITLAILKRGREICGPRGIIAADTKVELGLNILGHLMLGDEVLTPDSSRFWLASEWRPGGTQPSLNKQQLRDWLLNEAGWDKRPETAPELPEHIVDGTRQRYIRAYEMITGEKWR
jgi:phosphoribosylaminoimidazole-succinocarboxamide synthase